MILKWTDKYSVGNRTLDEQHMKLIDLINELMRDSSAESIDDVIDELIDYASYHFDFEEKLLEDLEYDSLEEQEQEHLAFTKGLTEMIDLFQSNSLKINKLHEFLVSWLNNHILVEDMKYSKIF